MLQIASIVLQSNYCQLWHVPWQPKRRKFAHNHYAKAHRPRNISSCFAIPLHQSSHVHCKIMLYVIFTEFSQAEESSILALSPPRLTLCQRRAFSMFKHTLLFQAARKSTCRSAALARSALWREQLMWLDEFSKLPTWISKHAHTRSGHEPNPCFIQLATAFQDGFFTSFAQECAVLCGVYLLEEASYYNVGGGHEPALCICATCAKVQM